MESNLLHRMKGEIEVTNRIKLISAFPIYIRALMSNSFYHIAVQAVATNWEYI